MRPGKSRNILSLLSLPTESKQVDRGSRRWKARASELAEIPQNLIWINDFARRHASVLQGNLRR